MPNKKISELPAGSALSGTELVELVQSGINVKMTAQDISDLGGGGGHTIEEEGTPLTQRTKLNFVGDGVTVTDDSGDDATVVTIPNPTINTATALTDGAAITITGTKHTLTTDEATITFTISYTGDDITIEVTLNATNATYTFPAGALCVSEGAESGDNTCLLTGVSGDKYIIAIKKFGSAYYVVSKNFGQ